jgi:hypothetical protein
LCLVVQRYKLPSYKTISLSLYAVEVCQSPTNVDETVITVHLGKGCGGVDPGNIASKSV